MKIKKLISYIVFLLLVSKAEAVSIIVDEEIESVIKAAIAPIIEASTLKKDEIKIYIVDEDEPNAFTTPGSEIFINSGLLELSFKPEILQGVMAHEIGHVIARHISNKYVEIGEAQKNSLLLSLVGIFGGVVTRSADAAAGSLIIGGAYLERQLYSYSRQHEDEADKIALDLLKKAHITSDGLIEFFNAISADNDGQIVTDPYLMTHPLSNLRITKFREFQRKNPYKVEFNKSLNIDYQRAIAKLKAYLHPREALQTKIADEATSKYARAIALYKIGKYEEARDLIKILMLRNNANPYYHELNAQIYLEQGNFENAVAEYKKSSELKKSSNLFKIELAIAEIKLADKYGENGKKLYLDEAVRQLKYVLARDMDNTAALHFLAICYGKQNKMAKYYVTMSEKSLIIGDPEKAKKYADAALTLEPDNQKARDILDSIK